MGDDNKLRAYLRLHLAAGVGPVLFKRLVEAFEGVEGVAAAGPGQWRRVEGVGEKTAAAMAAVTDKDIDEEIAEAAKRGVEILHYEDARYPGGLKNLYDYPPVLYGRGRIEECDAIGFGIVGSRQCTQYGLEQADRFAQNLARAGFTVMSGGARGIDAAAHRGALAAGGRTIAVMGCGLCQHYPPENSDLFEQIADGHGALVSELPMRTAVLSGNFPTRNRIISGLSLGVLVVEAARRSGSLITARVAAEQGRQVFALPGRVDSIASQGTNELIRNGTILAQCLPDILEHLGEVGSKITPADEPAPAPLLSAAMNEVEKTLAGLLVDGPLSVDDLARRSGIESGKVMSTMTMLMLKGLVTQRAGNTFERKKAAGKLF